jgi:resuscitation-promoting factor RpfA
MTDTTKPASGSTESHVDRAMLGPTPENPSLSLKTRLKRAAFFDKRDREVAAGKAEPVDADAGLPEQMVDDIAELEERP